MLKILQMNLYLRAEPKFFTMTDQILHKMNFMTSLASFIPLSHLPSSIPTKVDIL